MSPAKMLRMKRSIPTVGALAALVMASGGGRQEGIRPSGRRRKPGWVGRLTVRDDASEMRRPVSSAIESAARMKGRKRTCGEGHAPRDESSIDPLAFVAMAWHSTQSAGASSPSRRLKRYHHW